MRGSIRRHKDWLRGALAVFAVAVAAAAMPGGVWARQAEKVEGQEATSFVSEYTTRIRPDRLMDGVYKVRMKVLKPAGLQRAGQQSIPVIESMERVSVEAFVEKANGERIKVPESNILAQELNAGLAGIYQPDARLKVVIFPNLEVGDTTEIITIVSEKMSAFEGNFTQGQIFYVPETVGDTRFTIEYPKEIGLRFNVGGTGVVEQPVVDLGTAERRSFSYHQPLTHSGSDDVSAFDWAPRVVTSTFRSYEDLGRAFGERAWPKAKVEPEIAALAQTITEGKTDPRAQAEAIDNWVKNNIRYVAIYRALARFIPNDAVTILHNRYGDCKDATTLTAALLAAKGIASEQVLINLGNSYTLQGVPVVGEFNHVLIYIPALDTYSDPTFSSAGFGVLSPLTYDKPVIRVSSALEAKLARTPPMDARNHTRTLRVDATVAADGTVSGTMEEIGTGTEAAMLRMTAAAVRLRGAEAIASARLTDLGQPGRGTYLPENEKNLADPYRVKGTFSLAKRMQISAGQAEAIPEGMPLFASAPHRFFGSRWPDRIRDFGCSSGIDTVEINVTFAPGAPLPVAYKPSAVGNALFNYSAHYALDGRTFKVTRIFRTTNAHQPCKASNEAMLTEDLQKVSNSDNVMMRFSGRR